MALGPKHTSRFLAKSTIGNQNLNGDKIHLLLLVKLEFGMKLTPFFTLIFGKYAYYDNYEAILLYIQITFFMIVVMENLSKRLHEYHYAAE